MTLNTQNFKWYTNEGQNFEKMALPLISIIYMPMSCHIFLVSCAKVFSINYQCLWSNEVIFIATLPMVQSVVFAYHYYYREKYIFVQGRCHTICYEFKKTGAKDYFDIYSNRFACDNHNRKAIHMLLLLIH